MMIFAVAEEGRKGEPMVDKELIEIWRNMLKPSISSRLLKTNYEGKGEQDKEEFERDFDEILDLALIGLKHKAQLSQESTTSDLIDRQAALKALRKCQTYLYNARDTELKIELSSAEAAINNLSPIQPEERTKKRAETRACDLISRQAAIDAAALSAAEWDGMYVQDINGRIRKALEQLPPAQPEREKGKWIQNDNGTYSCSLCHSWIPEEQHYYAQFCLYCGADMRGEQDDSI